MVLTETRKTTVCFFLLLIFYSLSIESEKERRKIISGFSLAIIMMLLLTDQLDLPVSFLVVFWSVVN